jgi:drug/metabolite transporter (DMT)-like permease
MGLIGTPALFVLYVVVIRRWTVSATSYQFVIAPIIAIALGAILLDERVTPLLLLGAPLVLAGVWVGALLPERRSSEVTAPSSGT